MNLILLIFYQHLDQHDKLVLRKSKSELLTDIDMLLMVEKRIREGICHTNIYMQKQIINI